MGRIFPIFNTKVAGFSDRSDLIDKRILGINVSADDAYLDTSNVADEQSVNMLSADADAAVTQPQPAAASCESIEQQQANTSNNKQGSKEATRQEIKTSLPGARSLDRSIGDRKSIRQS